MIIYTFSDRILSLNKINITKLLPEILKILKLDDNNSLAVLEHPTGSGNVCLVLTSVRETSVLFSKVTETVRQLITEVILAEESKGHILRGLTIIIHT